MNKDKFLKNTLDACQLLKDNTDYLTQLDSKFGDGDHGYTISKISDFIIKTINDNKSLSLQEIYLMIGNGILSMGAGSVSSLWGMLFTGFSEALISDEVTCSIFKQMFIRAKEKLDIISNAKVGDKTLMDAFIPAYEIAMNDNYDFNSLLVSISKASLDGACDTEKYVAKYGRFKSYNEQTIGTPDPGAISLSLFIKGITTI